jgi:hypothetical protein
MQVDAMQTSLGMLFFLLLVVPSFATITISSVNQLYSIWFWGS